jgi:beta-lactamase regulating signal transducer with metallopeptidase domain
MQPNFTLFSDSLTHALGWMVVHSLWQATAIAVLTGIVLIFLRKKSPKTRYIVANVALFAVFAASVATFAYYYQPDAPSDTMIVTSSDPSVKPVVKWDETTKAELEQAQATLATTMQNRLSLAAFKSYFSEHLPLIVTIWLLGVVAFLLRLMGGISYVYYLKGRMNFPADEYWLDMVDGLAAKTGLKKGVDLVESALTRTPMVVGHTKPMILFPLGVLNRLSPQEVEAILAHELAHVLRHDYIFNILQSIVEALFYFHPAVWWLSSQIRNERESCCDDIAIKLIGNSVNYAKALVAIQEMAYFPMTPALAFAGQARKSQFLMRMQRILNQSNNKSNVMEKLIATLFIIITIVGLNVAQGDVEQKSMVSTDDTYFSVEDNEPMNMSGIWEADIENGKVEIHFSSRTKNSNWNTTEEFEKSELSAMPITEGAFTVSREAGVMEFTGKFDGNSGFGKFTFKPSNDFKSYLASQGTEGVKDETLLFCFIGNMGKKYVEFMALKSYKPLTNKQLSELAIFRLHENLVNAYLEMFAKSGVKNPSLHKLVELKIHNVTPQYIEDITAYGFVDVPIQQILEAKIHGINGDWLKTFGKPRTTDPFSLKDMIEMKIHGIDGNYVKELEAKSGKQIAHNRIVESKIHGLDRIDFKKMEEAGVNVSDDDDKTAMAIHGVDETFAASMKAAFGKPLDADDLVAAKIHGLNSDILKAYKAAFGNLDFDDAIAFKIHGLTPEYVQGLKNSGFPNIKTDDAMAFKIHGVTPQYVAELKNLGLTKIDADDAVAFKIHGVNPKDIKGFEDLGYKNLDPDDLVAFRIHGVTPSFVKGLNDLGFKNIDADDLVACKIHGVTAESIKEMNDAGFKSTDLQDYINKRVRNRGWGSSSKRSNNYIAIPTPVPVVVPVDTREAPRTAERALREQQKEMQRAQRDAQKANQDAMKIQQESNKIALRTLEKLNQDLDIEAATNNKALNWFVKELEKDGLLTIGKYIEVRFDKNRLTVNGQKQSPKLFEKYKNGVSENNANFLEKDFQLIMEGVVEKIHANGGFIFSGKTGFSSR